MYNKFSIIIPNYNGQEIIKENIPSIIRLSQKYNAPIIIGDDCSQDDSINILINQFKFTPVNENEKPPKENKRILIIKSKNEGFSSNVNLCISYALTPLVLLLNTDVLPREDAIDPLFPYFEDEKTFAVGMVDFDDKNNTHGRGKFIFHEGFLLHNKTEIVANGSEKITTGWVSCGSGMFSRKIWNDLGGLDPLFNPFYFEDVDIGYRSWKQGYKNYVEPKAICTHLHKKGAIKKNFNEEQIKTISYRNQFIFNWKNISDSDLIAKHLASLPRQILISIKNNDRPFLKGLLNAIKLWSKIRNSRLSKINQYIKTDNEIIASLKL